MYAICSIVEKVLHTGNFSTIEQMAYMTFFSKEYPNIIVPLDLNTGKTKVSIFNENGSLTTESKLELQRV